VGFDTYLFVAASCAGIQKAGTIKYMKKIILPLITLSALAVAFQNCGPKFEDSAAGTSASSSTSSSATTTVPKALPGGAPAAPSGLSVSVASSAQINLSWVDNSNNETHFIVQRAPSNGGPASPGTGPSTFTNIATVIDNKTTYSDNNLPPNTLFYYRVFAVNGTQPSFATAYVSATTGSAPVVIPPTPINLSAVATAASVISLSWTDNSSSENYFRVERSSNGGGTFTVAGVTSANVSTFKDINLNEQTNYVYRVIAVNNIGSSAASANANATTLAAGNKASYSYLAANVIGPNCVDCHGPALASRGIQVATYQQVVALGNTLISIVSGGAARMPPGSPLQADQINSIQAWINAGRPNN
jgi:mono/diheme cytochrome c family protein